MRILALVALVSMTTAYAAVAEPSTTTGGAAAASSAAPARYSVSSTPIGTLLGDPAAKAVLVKHVPEVATNDQIESVRDMTLSDVQGFAPDQLTDEVLAAIEADLAKLPAKN